MNTNNEKWHGSPKKGGNSYDSREGRHFEKGGNNSPFSKPGRNQKVYSSQNTSNSNYDNRSTGGNPIIRTKTRNHTDDLLLRMKIRKVKIAN